MGSLPKALWKSHWGIATVPRPPAPLSATPSPLFPTLLTPTLILTPQITLTTPTPPHQPQPLSPLSHPSYLSNMPENDKKPLLACTTSTASTTTSINMSACTIFPMIPSSKRTKQSPQITIPKRNPPILCPFISTNFRLKKHKKYPLPSTHHKTCLTTHPTMNSTPSPTCTTKTPPNTKKYQPLMHSSPPLLLYTTLPPLLCTILSPPSPPTTTINTNPITTINPPTPPPLPHKHKSHPLWNSTSPTHPDSTHHQCHWSFPCHHPPHPPSFPECWRNFSDQTLGESPTRPTAGTQGSLHHLAILKKFNPWNIIKSEINDKKSKPNKNKFPFHFYNSVFLLTSLIVWPIPRADILKARYTKYVSSQPWIRLCVSCLHHASANNLRTASHKIRLSVSASPLSPLQN